jgi:SAM-dependent methyltransferase
MPVDAQALRQAIRKVYSQVADDPKKGYHFHTGPDYAAERLGYFPEELAELPGTVTASFAGVGNPLAMGFPRPGDTVVDIGAGSGMDTFLAARHVGPAGLVLAVDMTPAMLELGRQHVALTGLKQVEYVEGLAETLPLPDGIADLVISNGVINLVPDKDRVFAEALRVLKPGGRLQIADVVVHRDIPPAAREDVTIWTARIGGALLEGEYLVKIGRAGFQDVEVAWRGLPFVGATGQRRADKYEAEGVNIRARKP